MRLAPRRHAEDAPGEPAQTSLLPEPEAPAFALPEPLYAQDGTVFLQELPAALLTPLRAVQAPLQAWLEDNPEADAHPQMLELYFAVQDLVRAAERYDSHFVTQLTARAAFLARFEPDPAHTLLGFAVMGGIFGEGVDLAGDRLIGCAIVGVGLPQVNPRQEMLRRYYDAQNGAGFDYAYRYPGMNKVLQAAGRVIRTPEDKGVVLLLDDRFAKPDYQRLFPLHWKHLQYLQSSAALEAALAAFWGSRPE